MTNPPEDDHDNRKYRSKTRCKPCKRKTKIWSAVTV